MTLRRLLLLAAMAVAVPLGYWLRFKAPVAEALRDASGGATYVVFWALDAALLWPRARASRVAVFTLLATCAVEFSQIWHPEWLDRIRATLPGRLLLGSTFDWHDFPPYFCGAVLAWVLLAAIQHVAARGERL